MGIHHVAIATNDLAASHRFYDEAMGFELVHVQAGRSDDPSGRGWAKHVFYDTGDGTLLALWDLHDPRIPEAFDAAWSRGLGLPTWVNHLAFHAADQAALVSARERWLRCGLDVLRIDHGWTESIYTDDPDGNMVEWCRTITPFGTNERMNAQQLLGDPDPPLDPQPTDIEFFSPPGPDT
jgi:catechol 2,3-dioxygenase-like lactoylglutathione lyase family enzyme